MSNGNDKASKKTGIKSQKTFRRYTCSWQHHQYEKSATTRYREKIKRHYERLPDKLNNTDRKDRMELSLLRDVFAFVHRRDYTADRTLRREDLEDIRSIFDDYKDYSLLYVPEGNKLPDGAIPLRKDSRLCFTDASRYGMRFGEFMLCMLGDDFVEECEKNAALSDWTGIPAQQMYDIYLDFIAAFFRDESVRRHKQMAKWYGGDLGFLHCEDFRVVYNYNVEASSGATININNR